jgi:hypothetical protein
MGTENEVPKCVQDKLVESETVIGMAGAGQAFGSRRAVDLFATNRRLLVFNSPSNYDSLQYDKVSVTLAKYGPMYYAVRGIFVVCALVLLGLAAMLWYGLLSGELSNRNYFSAIFVSVFCLGGVLVSLWEAVMLYAYYQIGEVNSYQKNWRIPRHRFGSKQADRFAEIVRKQIKNFQAVIP